MNGLDDVPLNDLPLTNVPRDEVPSVVEEALRDDASEVVVTKQANGEYTVIYIKP